MSKLWDIKNFMKSIKFLVKYISTFSCQPLGKEIIQIAMEREANIYALMILKVEQWMEDWRN